MKVVILTCDNYAWLIPVFLHFYNKYWPDNPYQTEIITEIDHINGFVFYTKGASWSSGLLNYLKQSDDDKFLLIDEDCLIKGPVNLGRVKLAEKLCEGNIGCVRLNAPDKYYNRHAIESGVKFYKEYPLDKPYSMSLQAAIWQKKYLLEVLWHKEDGWQAELIGSKRVANMKGRWRILWAKSAVIDYHGGGIMRKGQPALPVVKWALLELING
jgi:hypothetical protein